jgi:broad specificity phosphatase PhoE
MKKIYLIRHGETESNRKGIFRGRLDVPLSRNGKEQAKDLNRYFQNLHVDVVYTSPLQRAVETAETVFPRHTPIREETLNNLDLGEWSGMEKSLVKERFPAMWENWVKRPESIRFPGGERLDDVHQRARRFFEKILAREAEITAAVSHRSVVKVMIAAALGVERNYYWRLHLDNASVSLLHFEEERGFTLVKLNETHHLKNIVVEWY